VEGAHRRAGNVSSLIHARLEVWLIQTALRAGRPQTGLHRRIIIARALEGG
jgi:hypothetical protein